MGKISNVVVFVRFKEGRTLLRSTQKRKNNHIIHLVRINGLLRRVSKEHWEERRREEEEN